MAGQIVPNITSMRPKGELISVMQCFGMIREQRKLVSFLTLIISVLRIEAFYFKGGLWHSS